MRLSGAMVRGAFNYVTRRETPVRRLAREAIVDLAPRLKGRVIELGGFGEGRRSMATSATEYLVTNLTSEADMVLDATAMDLPDASVDGILCESMLEHVAEPWQVVVEMRRVLKPGGLLLLVTPWMYPFHSAPGDYFRYSHEALRTLLAGFVVDEVRPLGNFWTAMATFAQLKVSPWRSLSKLERAARIVAGAPLLLNGLAFLAASKVLTEADDFATAYAVLARRSGAPPSLEAS